LPRALAACCKTRVGQNYILTVYIRYYWQGNHQTYGRIGCIFTVLANPTCIPVQGVAARRWCPCWCPASPQTTSATGLLILGSSLCARHPCLMEGTRWSCTHRVGQNRIHAPYMTLYLVISQPKIPYIHHMYVILSNHI
jgi:hypothetical protein